MARLNLRPFGRGRIGPLRENLNALEWLRFLSERFVLIPAATYLPLNTAMALANAIGAADALLPTRTTRATRAEMHAATGFSGARLATVTRERLTMPRRDLVWRQRMRKGRERIADWRAIEINPEGVHALLAAKQSFIAAGGHFVSAAGDARYLVLPPQGPAVGGPLLRWRLSPFNLRSRLDSAVDQDSREGLLGLPRGASRDPSLKAAAPDFWSPGMDWTRASTSFSVQDEVLAALAVPGTVSQILIDALWEKPNAYRRPFAGMAERGFALGAARIARLAQCPVVPFVAVLGPNPRTVILDWGNPILPPAIDDKASDRVVIDQAIAFIERGVRSYPTQYLHPVGTDRTWNPRTQAWETPER